MSMTREEIIKSYEDAVVASGLAAAARNEEAAKSYELFKAGLSALRPVSRDRIEKVWSGCHECSGCKLCIWNETKKCNDCKNRNSFRPLSDFCPRCGKPLTDEALEMVMERMEALYEKT